MKMTVRIAFGGVFYLGKISCLMVVPFFIRRFMNRAVRMLYRRINGVQFEWLIACVDEVMPFPGRDYYYKIFSRFLDKGKRFFRVAHHHFTLSILDA